MPVAITGGDLLLTTTGFLSFALAFVVVSGSCPWVIQALKRLQLFDVASGRSSHRGAVPRGGGVAIFLGIVVGLASTGVWGDGTRAHFALLGVVACFSILGWMDDVRSRSVRLRLISQVGLAAVFSVVSGLNDVGSIAGLLLALVVTVWVVGFVNAFNFMDGINGISSVTALIVALALAAGSFRWGRDTTGYIGLVVAGGSAGFLPFNAVRARVFMGDVGSYLLGAVLSMLAVIAVADGVPLLVVAAPFLIYVGDVGWTLIVRIHRGERLFASHRGHVYQLLANGRLGHFRTAVIVATMTMALAALASVGSIVGAPPAVLIVPAVALVLGYLALPGIVLPHGQGDGRVIDLRETPALATTGSGEATNTIGALDADRLAQVLGGSSAAGQRVFIVSELYFPEETSTGHALTAIAEGLAPHFDVRVICAQPSYSMRGVKAPHREQRYGVAITRVWSSSLDPHRIATKLVNYVTVSASCFVRSLREFRRGDCVLVVTNPPLLPLLVLVAARLRGATCTVIVHDLYPDVLVPAGKLSDKSIRFRAWAWANARMLRVADSIVVLGRDQAERVAEKLDPDAPTRLHVIRQAADLDEVRPQPRSGNQHLKAHGLDDPEKLIIQFAGNIGPLQNIDRLLEMMAGTAHLPEVHYIFFGRGGSRAFLETEVSRRQLENVTVLDPVSRCDAEEVHAACDIVLVSLSPGMRGISVPSRIGNSLASGRPILGVVESGTELQRLLAETGVGWWCDATDVAGYVRIVERLSADRSQLWSKQSAARQVATELFDVDSMIEKYRAVVTGGERERVHV